MGSPLNRIMAINVLKNHGKVFVFDHGVGAGLKDMEEKESYMI